MRSVWSINTPKPIEKKYGKHPTQKPLDLLRRIVLASTNKGNIILDPFTGSSTAGIAASMYDREFIGIDTEKKYLDLSIKRFKDVKFVDMEQDVQYRRSDEDLKMQPYMLETSKKYKKTRKNKIA